MNCFDAKEYGARLRRLHAQIAFVYRRAYTILELIIVITIAAIILAIAIPGALHSLDRLSVHSAANDVITILSSARALALASHSSVAVDIDSLTGVLRVRRGDEIVSLRAVGFAHGVSVRRNRDSLSFDARGLGRGAANLSVIIRRRSAVETVFVSRLGRVR